MSEHIVKIIPTDPFYKIQEQTLQSAKRFLQTQISCDFIEVELNEMPVFVDCGANLEMISCPECKADLDFDWWGETMDTAAHPAFLYAVSVGGWGLYNSSDLCPFLKLQLACHKFF